MGFAIVFSLADPQDVNAEDDTLMEDVKTFQQWMFQMIKDSMEKLGMTDETLAECLLKEGIKYYHRTIAKCETCPYKLKH